MQSVPITTKVVSSNPTHAKVYLIQLYVIKFIIDLQQVCGFSGYSGFLRHDITEILLKVALNTITLALYLYNPCIQIAFYCFFSMFLAVVCFTVFVHCLTKNFDLKFICDSFIILHKNNVSSHRSYDPIVGGFTSTYAISAYHH